MCISPITISNPNYGKKGGLNFLKDTISKTIRVPCGTCPECIHTKQNYLVQRFQMEGLKNEFFFCTLTYNDLLPSVKVNGYDICYADLSDVVKMIKRLRKDNAFGVPFRYFAVSELGSKNGRPHFHIIFIVSKSYVPDYNHALSLEAVMFTKVLSYWSRNYGTRKNPVYVPLCDYKTAYRNGRLHSNYDLHFVNRSFGSDVLDVSYYVLKYMLKPSDRARRLYSALKLNVDEKEFPKLWNKIKPRYFKSLDFGLSKDSDVQRYIKGCVSRSKSISDFPLFFDAIQSKSFPLSRFYKSNGDLFSVSDALDFYYKSNDDVYIDDRTPSEFDSILESFSRQRRSVVNNSQDVYLDSVDDDFLDTFDSLPVVTNDDGLYADFGDFDTMLRNFYDGD